MRVVEQQWTPQPPLPSFLAAIPEVADWWADWEEHPLRPEFSALDWSYLRDTAVLYADFVETHSVKIASELRIRLSQFGITPADRARLRIQVATADTAEPRSSSSRRTNDKAQPGPERFADLRVVE